MQVTGVAQAPAERDRPRGRPGANPWRIPVRLPRLLAGGAVFAVVAGTAACGAQALEPRVALRDALSDFAAQQTGAVELSVPSSAKEVRAFAAATDPSGPTADDISDDDLSTLLSSSVDFAYD